MSIVDLFQFPHFILILIGICLISISLIMVAFHKPKKWFPLHTILAATGILLIIIGIVMLGGLTLVILHGILGLISIIILVYSIIAGFVAYKLKNKSIRSAHIWVGRIIYIVALVALIVGIITFI
ncbi:MAG: hypothetical protein ACFE8M_10460 [Candidatus Hermodarchaeota archaeon]